MLRHQSLGSDRKLFRKLAKRWKIEFKHWLKRRSGFGRLFIYFYKFFLLFSKLVKFGKLRKSLAIRYFIGALTSISRKPYSFLYSAPFYRLLFLLLGSGAGVLRLRHFLPFLFLSKLKLKRNKIKLSKNSKKVAVNKVKRHSARLIKGKKVVANKIKRHSVRLIKGKKVAVNKVKRRSARLIKRSKAMLKKLEAKKAEIKKKKEILQQKLAKAKAKNLIRVKKERKLAAKIKRSLILKLRKRKLPLKVRRRLVFRIRRLPWRVVLLLSMRSAIFSCLKSRSRARRPHGYSFSYKKARGPRSQIYLGKRPAFLNVRAYSVSAKDNLVKGFFLFSNIGSSYLSDDLSGSFLKLFFVYFSKLGPLVYNKLCLIPLFFILCAWASFWIVVFFLLLSLMLCLLNLIFYFCMIYAFSFIVIWRTPSLNFC